MTVLTVYSSDKLSRHYTRYTDLAEIQEHLNSLGVEFEQWDSSYQIANDADQNVILDAYHEPIEQLKTKHHFQSIDVIRVTPDQPEKEAIRKKFLSEHIHEDFEIRFFVEGCGLFYLHLADKVYAVLCERGDLISVPAGTKHWFDMGENPSFTCIRFFTTPYGWVAKFTDDPIAESFPTMDQFIADSHD